MITLEEILELVKAEFIRATSKFGSMHSAHEGFAIIHEEFDELKKNVWLNQKTPNRDKLIKEEALHVATMAIRLIYDCCGGVD